MFAWEDARRRIVEKVITQYHWVSRSKVVRRYAKPACPWVYRGRWSQIT